jgi:ATP-dependent exoDNAse (exonuclease V) beta subunit
MPFCNWGFKTNFHKNYIWVKDAGIQEGILFPIKTTSNLAKSIYAEPFLREIKLNWMDQINQLYVAFTRAKEVLIATCPFEKNDKNDINSASKLIKEVFIRMGETFEMEEDFLFEKGTIADLPAPENKASHTAEAINISTSLHHFQRPEIEAKFSSEDVKVGNLVHQAMYYLDSNEAKIAFAKAAAENNYSAAEIEAASTHFFNIISEESQFGQWLKNAQQTWNEQTFYFDNQELRPDKVIELKDKIVVIDFKTGDTKSSYQKQMKQYLLALQSMEIQKPIEGFVFYTESGVMDFVEA